MKKKLILFIAAILVIFVVALIHAESSLYKYKGLMHDVLENYNQARVSYTMKRYDIADIFLKHVQEYLIEAINVIPDSNTEGVKLDREVITKRLNLLRSRISDLRFAVQKKELKEINKSFKEIFDMCVTCHKEQKLKYLFTQPVGEEKTLFQEYMHEITELFKYAKTYAESGDLRETGDYLKLINFYLDLLEGVFPDKGPSGIILDRDGFIHRIRNFKNLNEDMQKNMKEKKTFNAESFRKSLNELCVACHEPERIK